MGGLLRRRWFWVAVLALLVAGYAGLAAWSSNRMPASARVAGVPVGGLDRATASERLSHAADELALVPVVLTTAGPTSAQLLPADAGLAIDVGATLDRLLRFTLNPAALWQRWRGEVSVPFRTDVDGDRLLSAVRAAAPQLDRAAKEGGIRFAGGKAEVTRPVDGFTVDAARTADAVAAGWPAATQFGAVVTVALPVVPLAEVDRVAASFAVPAMSAPLKVSVAGKKVELEPAAYGPALSVRAEGATLVPGVDGAKLAAAIRAAAPTAERPVKDATVRLRGGRPSVVAAVNGTAIEPTRLVAPALAALTSSTRSLTVPMVTREPRVTTAEAKDWRITEVVSDFTSYFPTGSSNAARTNNIRIAVRELNGTLVEPGEQFSLNAELGQRTPQKGYQSAPVIVGGRLTRDYGGGVSQVSTTVYNAAFFAGMQLDQHKPHSFYISRYPEGREATVSWPSVDNKWTNDSGYGVLIETWVSGNAVRMRFWGTKVWDIDSVRSPRSNFREPEDIVDDSPTCVTQSPQQGFDVTVTRLFRKDGRTVKRDSYTTRYIAEDKVTCTHPSAR